LEGVAEQLGLADFQRDKVEQRCFHRNVHKSLCSLDQSLVKLIDNSNHCCIWNWMWLRFVRILRVHCA